MNGTLNGDVELKREAWKIWKIEERFGVQMVRRSIAKYRQELDIPSFKERKFLYKLEML